ncbi:hypothetical protein PMIN06_010280 [Paraphaeosphaeria minitans]
MSRSQRKLEMALNALDLNHMCDIFDRTSAKKLLCVDLGTIRGTEIIQTDPDVIKVIYSPLVALTVLAYDCVGTSLQSPAKYSQRFADAAHSVLFKRAFGSGLEIHDVQAVLILMLLEIEKHGDTETTEQKLNKVQVLHTLAKLAMDLDGWASNKEKFSKAYQAVYQTCETFYILQKDVEALVGLQTDVQIGSARSAVFAVALCSWDGSEGRCQERMIRQQHRNTVGMFDTQNF